VRRLKPAPEPYLMAAERLGVAIAEIRLVAAHAWGHSWRSPGRLCRRLRCPARQGPGPAGRAAEIIGADLADAILAIDHGDQRP
jgi:2-haloacid dehalogenase